MSTTPHQATRERTDNAAVAFGTLIFENADVCSNCFCRLGDSEHARLHRAAGMLRYNRFYRDRDGVLVDFPNLHDEGSSPRHVCNLRAVWNH